MDNSRLFFDRELYEQYLSTIGFLCQLKQMGVLDFSFALVCEPKEAHNISIKWRYINDVLLIDTDVVIRLLRGTKEVHIEGGCWNLSYEIYRNNYLI